MNIGLLIFLLSIAGMIGLSVYAHLDSRRHRREVTKRAEESERTLQSAHASAHRINQGAYLASIMPKTWAELERTKFVQTVERKVEVADLVAVPISDTWREQMTPVALARFMNDNPGCKLRMDGPNVVLYVPDEDIATMAMRAL